MSAQQTHLKVLITNTNYFPSTWSDRDCCWINKAMGKTYEKMACTTLKIQVFNIPAHKGRLSWRIPNNEGKFYNRLRLFLHEHLCHSKGRGKINGSLGDSELKINWLLWVTLSRILRKRNHERRFQDHRRVPLNSQLHVNLEISFLI